MMDQKHVLITGATGGIGKATATLLAQKSFKLCLVGRSEQRLADLCAILPGNGHHYLVLDLEDLDSFESVLKDKAKSEGPFNGFVHAAGSGAVRPLKQTRPRFLKDVMTINFFSFIEIARIISSKPCKGDKLNIVGISATGAFLGNASKTAYCSSKAAMNAATRCLAKELASKGIRVNTVAPGATETKMMSDILNLPSGDIALSKIIERQFLGVCSPYDIAEGILFLLNSSSKMITGHCLAIDGGKLIN